MRGASRGVVSVWGGSLLCDGVGGNLKELFLPASAQEDLVGGGEDRPRLSVIDDSSDASPRDPRVAVRVARLKLQKEKQEREFQL